jgi:hypothetical protein
MNELFAPTLPKAGYAGVKVPDSRDHCQSVLYAFDDEQ